VFEGVNAAYLIEYIPYNFWNHYGNIYVSKINC
jgi:hypothetical protein